MAKVKVKVLNAVVDGHKQGEVISIDEKSAKHLESINYVARVTETKSAPKDDGGKKEDDK